MLPEDASGEIFDVQFQNASEVGTPAFVLERNGSSGLTRLRVAALQTKNGPWHFLGCRLAVCTVHIGGGVGLYFTPRTLIRLTPPEQSPDWRLQWNGLEWQAPLPERIEFGCGYVTWIYVLRRDSEHSIRVRRMLRCIDTGAFELAVDFSGLTSPALYEEQWVFRPLAFVPVPLMGFKALPPGGARVHERGIQWLTVLTSRAVRAAGLWLRSLLSSALRFDSVPTHDGIVLVPRQLPLRAVWRSDKGERPAVVDCTMPYISFTASSSTSAEVPTVTAQAGRARGTQVMLRARVGEQAGLQSVRFHIRLEDRHARSASQPVGHPFLKPQTDANPLPRDRGLAAELLWHLACLRQLSVYDPYFERAFITQGSAYLFSHGVHGAPRDYAIAAVAILPFDRELARTTIETMMLMTRPDGSMYYMHTGRGWCSGAVVHESPSDLPIFLLWALSEYIEQTGDLTFLDEALPFYPKHNGRASTVRQRIILAFQWLRDRLGTGPHSLLRVGSGDWMDPIALMTKRPRRFHQTGESGLNTAFAVYALRHAAKLLGSTSGRIAEEMCDFASALAQAMEQQWNGRWFLRGWDGAASPLGFDHLFADVQAFCLVAEIGSPEVRARVAEELYQRCIEGSPTGACILDRPHWTRYGLLPPGWDCNGGIWAAINAFLCWGLALQRPDLAEALFEKLRVATRARAYPGIWYGLWSGPDCFNAPYASRPGETFHLPATPMDEFPVMNSNWHAAPLLAWQKLRATCVTWQGSAPAT